MINLKNKDSVASKVEEILQQEALKGQQHKIDKNKNNKIDSQDFAILRGEKKSEVKEALVGGQHEIDKNKNNKIDAQDFKILRGEKKGVKKEEVEQIDELSKSTLGSYVKKASDDAMVSRKLGSDFANKAKRVRGDSAKGANTRLADRFNNMAMKRRAGVNKAVDRLTKEEAQIDERKMTTGETAEKERIVKGMKKSLAGFKARYGDRAKNVMYATATKQAMKEEQLDEKDDPCWSGYTMVGMKKKGGRDVPNCVPAKGVTKAKGFKEETEEVKENSPFDWKKPRTPEPKGGAGVKAGRAYGGAAQKSKPEQEEEPKKKVTESKRPESDTVPFEGPYNTSSSPVVTDKSGAKHTPLSRVKHLAKQAMKKVQKDLGNK
jgi:hypothetical protein